MTKYQIHAQGQSIEGFSTWQSHEYHDMNDAIGEAIIMAGDMDKFIIVRFTQHIAKVLEFGFWVKYGLHSSDAELTYAELEEMVKS